MAEGITEDRINDLEYKFRVVYTYSNEWIDRLIEEVSDSERFNQIKRAPAYLR